MPTDVFISVRKVIRTIKVKVKIKRKAPFSFGLSLRNLTIDCIKRWMLAL